MSQAFRLPQGGRIDRSRTSAFRFDGRRLEGHPGDTLASALLANGVRLVARSFKYHRPRGIVGLGVEEPNALVRLERGPGRSDPNTRATTLELYDGLAALSQNRWPSLGLDLGALVGAVAPALPAGFYYKTFMWPRIAWRRIYEPALRAMAGLGRAPALPDPDRYAFRNGHCDVLVVGAGPAGIAAALAAAEQNLSVVICDEGPELGGALLGAPGLTVESRPAWDWLAEMAGRLAAAGVRILRRTTAYGYYADNMVGLSERLTDHMARGDGPRERLWLMRARRVVLATGAIERPLLFRNNDRPGVMLASAAAAYPGRYGVLPGRRAVICGAHDEAYESAWALRRAGVEVTMADARAEAPGVLMERARAEGVEVVLGLAPVDVRGRHAVKGVALADGSQAPRRTVRWIDCDLVGMAGGWTPSVHLFSQSGGRAEWSPALGAFTPTDDRADQRSAGACAGVMQVDRAVQHGRAAGASLFRPQRRRTLSAAETARLQAQVESPPRATAHPAPGAPAFVDLQHDVTARDVALAVREGFRSIEHIKRYTTSGMATDQGRTSNINTLQLAADLTGRPTPDVGHTTFRQPYTPVTFGALAGPQRGALFDPLRRTPIDGWAEEHGAVFENVGPWRRARYFPEPGEHMAAAVSRECLATRRRAGLFDASTLGKIEVVGPDAAEFMNRLYINAWAKLEPGRCRYGVMLRENGFVMDDGVVGRIASDRFHVTTTTTSAPAVLHHMEDYLQTEWPDLRVWLTSTTEQWAVIALNGPAAREILSPLVSGIDLSAEAFPHMSVRTGGICGAPCRLFRVSFTGELGFEINVPARFGRTVWAQVRQAGDVFGLTPYGTETMHVLRAEKGYIIVGQESDGTQTPSDVGLDGAIGRKKRDFVGRRSLQFSALAADDRPQLVGLVSEDGRSVLEEGAQLVATRTSREPLGHVTSAYWSANLGQPIALALLRAGRSRIGEVIAATSLAGAPRPVRVVEPVFYDPEGRRLHV